MRIPTIAGIIDRRMLVNFTVDLEIANTIVPTPFKPKSVNGKAIAGICLIRLKQVRPKGLPAFVGVSSENGAHRIAVEWMENGELKEGVYIPRRDTSSYLNALVGGRVFPGRHYRAMFDIKEDANNYHIAFKSSDDTLISVDASTADSLPDQSVFKNLATASEFFKAGSIGYSPNGKKYDGLMLRPYRWEMTPLNVSNVRSSFFEDEGVFPKGSVEFDSAFLMTNIDHEWSSISDKFCP